MKILVGCEESQAVTIELRKLGHEAYSCDLQECSGGHPEWHLQMDVFEALLEIVDSASSILEEIPREQKNIAAIDRMLQKNGYKRLFN